MCLAVSIGFAVSKEAGLNEFSNVRLKVQTLGNQNIKILRGGLDTVAEGTV